MICKLLGTGAAEGIPALFCKCEICTKAMQAGGRNIRGRSCLMVNDSVLIDFPPDMLSYKIRDNLNLASISDIFFTHSHFDHLSAGELCYFHNSYVRERNFDSVINIYGNSKVLEVIEAALYFDMNFMPDSVVLNLLTAFKTVEIADLRITALPAVHDPNEECFYFLIEQQSSKVLLANDGGKFSDELYSYLADVQLNAVILDCTGGKLEPAMKSHMCFAENLEVMERLKAQGSADNATMFVSHHFSHNGLINYDDFEKVAKGSGFISSYDGMEICL